MKKINITIATLILVVFTTVLLTSCHRNTCPTFGEAEVQDTEVKS